MPGDGAGGRGWLEKASVLADQLVDKGTVVLSVYPLSRKHRPDLAINDEAIAVEIKFLTDSLDGLKQAIGKSILVRVSYRFVINFFVVDERYKDKYLKGATYEDKDLDPCIVVQRPRSPSFGGYHWALLYCSRAAEEVRNRLDTHHAPVHLYSQALLIVPE